MKQVSKVNKLRENAETEMLSQSRIHICCILLFRESDTDSFFDKNR